VTGPTDPPPAEEPPAENDVSAADGPETAGETSFSANEGRPMLRVVRGIPDGVDASLEVAVLTAVLSARGGEAETGRPAPSAWNAPARLVQQPVHPSADGWRLSARPR
jgi:hypothetical protein